MEGNRRIGMAEVRNEINELSNIYVLLENVYMF
jgi:hypothetical protein